MSNDKVTLSFGIYMGASIYHVPSDYLCWVCAAFKGGIKPKCVGDKPFSPPEVDFVKAKKELDRRGYNTKGIWPKKDEGSRNQNINTERKKEKEYE